MEKKLETLAKEDKAFVDDYLENIKNEVNEGNFFKEALDWYYFRYVSPINDRTLLIIGALISCVICYFVYTIVKSSFPLVIKEPIIIKAKDQSKYVPRLIELKPKAGKFTYDQGIKNIDEAIAKYLISIYIKDREEYDFSDSSIESVNLKINRIKNNSTLSEFKNFQNFFSEDNPQSPIQNFGKNVIKTIKIDAFRFARTKPRDFKEQVIEYFNLKLPTQATVTFKSSTNYTDEYGEKKVLTEKFLVKIKFNFKPVVKINNDDPKSKKYIDRKLKFHVENYQLYRVKN